MENRTFYYARVSTAEQNLDRQIMAFKELGASDRDIITDKQSGKDLDRPGYNALKSTILRPGDTLVIKSLDRLSRSKADITQELQYFKANNIRLKIIDLPTTMTTVPEGMEWAMELVNNIMIEVFGSIAEEERKATLKRMNEGIAAARARGAKFGRPTVRPENWDEVIEQWKNGQITAVKAMELTKTKRSTFYKLVKTN